MQIKVYRFIDGEYRRIGTTEKGQNITYNIDLYNVSEFDFEIPINARYAADIQENDFININTEFWGRIEKIEQKPTEGKIIVSGLDLKSLLTQRQIVPIDYTSTNGTAGYMTVTGSTEYCIKYLWENNAQNPPQTGRAYPNMAILPNQNRGTAEDKYMARFEVLDEATAKLCKDSKIGYIVWIDLENNWLCFEVYKGIDRTLGQNVNSRAVFEVDRHNIANLEYSKDLTNFKNAFYTTKDGADFEDEALTLLYYRNDIEATGFDRRETHISLSVDVAEGSEYTEMKRLAEIEMKEYDIEEGFNCELSPRSGYNEKWNVGDFATVRHKDSGLLVDTQITGVTVTAGENEINYIAKFGEQKPKFVAVNKRIIKI